MTTTSPSVLHVGEAALTAATLVTEARRRGLAWDAMPLASSRRDWSGPVAKAQKAALGARWLGLLAVRARRHDIVHVHSASTFQHSRYAVHRYVLHCHGTDVRTAQYEDGFGPTVRAALDGAEAVVFSTPDLAEHVLPRRPDALYLPVPVDTDTLPTWRAPERPRIAFASRWEGVKGLAVQLDTASQLVAALDGRADVVGLDWGPAAPEAAAAGVRLVPRMDHAAYLSWLAGATAVVGQAAGILSASELEALGTGAPLLMPAPMPLYADEAPPVLGGSPASVVEAAAALVGGEPHDAEAGRLWTARVHGVNLAVDHLLAIYADVISARA